MPPHGVWDTSYAAYAFNFAAGDMATIFDVQDSTFNPDGSPNVLDGLVSGYRKDFQVDVDFLTVSGVSFHIDLVNTDGDQPPGDLFAPFSKDATLVPEPRAALVFGVGCVVVGFALRKRLY
jgi:hypothetical protein